MKMLITPSRIRSVIAGAMTERDVTDSLRSHRIKYSYSTDGGYGHIRIPARSGSVVIYRTVSRSAPFIVRSAPAADSLRLWPAYY